MDSNRQKTSRYYYYDVSEVMLMTTEVRGHFRHGFVEQSGRQTERRLIIFRRFLCVNYNPF